MAVKERISLMATSDSDLFLADSDFDDSGSDTKVRNPAVAVRKMSDDDNDRDNRYELQYFEYFRN